jgi:hypothetical protein
VLLVEYGIGVPKTIKALTSEVSVPFFKVDEVLPGATTLYPIIAESTLSRTTSQELNSCFGVAPVI